MSHVPHVGGEETIRTAAGFAITRAGEIELDVKQTPRREHDVSARADEYTVVHRDGHVMTVRCVRAVNGEQWIEARDIESDSALMRSLEGRRRLTIEVTADGLGSCVMKIVEPVGDAWTTLRSASAERLDEASGTSVEAELRRVGALEVGTRQHVLGETGRTRGLMCATFDIQDALVPVLAFLLTRVSPLVADAYSEE